jgi:hypothetical protein
VHLVELVEKLVVIRNRLFSDAIPELDFLDCVSVMESRFDFCPHCKVDKSHKCDLCRGKKCYQCCIRYRQKIAPKMPPTRQLQHFRQQRAQQAPAPRRQGYQHMPLSQARNLPLERQLATAFYHIAAACARVVHAFSGPNVPTGGAYL